jgi:hypothetical protein
MCDVLLPPGVNPTVVKYIYIISYHIISYIDAFGRTWWRALPKTLKEKFTVWPKCKFSGFSAVGYQMMTIFRFLRNEVVKCNDVSEQSTASNVRVIDSFKWILTCLTLFPCNRKGSLTCRKSATQDPRLYFPSEGRHAEDFYARKNPTANSGTRDQHANH